MEGRELPTAVCRGMLRLLPCRLCEGGDRGVVTWGSLCHALPCAQRLSHARMGGPSLGG